MALVLDVDQLVPKNRYRMDVIGGVQTGPFEVAAFPAAWTRRWRDKHNTANYGYYVKSHTWLPENGYEIRKEVVTFPQGYPYMKAVWVPTGDYSLYYGPDPDGWSNVTYFELTDAQRILYGNDLSSRLLDKIKSQKVNLAVFAAERTQMLNMFGNTINRIAKAYTSVRRLRFGDAFRALGCGSTRRVSPFKSAANNWLELQYGWLPLLSDVYGASEEYERTWQRRIAEDKNPIFRERVSMELSDADVFVTGKIHQVVNREFTSLIRAWCAYTVDDESMNFLSRVGLTNPLAVAWEVVPFSFVVDWFLPVGRFLNTLDATLGCTFKGGGSSYLVHSIITSNRVGTNTSGNTRYEWNVPTARGRYDRYVRGGFTSGFPAVTLPQLKDPVSQGHVANALALLTQAFSRK